MSYRTRKRCVRVVGTVVAGCLAVCLIVLSAASLVLRSSTSSSSSSSSLGLKPASRHTVLNQQLLPRSAASPFGQNSINSISIISSSSSSIGRSSSSISSSSSSSSSSVVAQFSQRIRKLFWGEPPNPSPFITTRTASSSWLFSPSSPSRYLFPAVSKKRIVFLHPPVWMDVEKENDFSTCAGTRACSLTSNLLAARDATAVIVNVNSVPRHQVAPPFGKQAGQVWVAYTQEAPPMCCHALLDGPGWRGVFNLTMGYRPSHDVFLPTAMLRRKEGGGDEGEGARERRREFVAIAGRKTKMVAWFVSNCHTQSKRELYVKELQKHIAVDVFGACGPLSCPREEPERCRQMLEEYRFYLSFENALCKDYVTEKMLDLYNGTDVIPVVRGHVDYARYFPAGSFIDTAAFPSPAALAARLKALAADVTTYGAMLEEKAKYETTFTLDQALCKLCDLLHSPTMQGQGRHYPDIAEELEMDACVHPDDF